MQIKISLGNTINSNVVENKTLNENEFIELVSSFSIVNQKTDLSYFIAGHFTNNRRNSQTLESKTLIVLDVDKFRGNLNDLIKVLDADLSIYKYMAYSTISHTVLHPKIRIVLFITEEIHKEDYAQIARNFINTLSFKDAIDNCSTKANQFMFLPGYNYKSYAPFTKINDGELVNPNQFKSPLPAMEIVKSDDLLSLIANKPLNLTNEEIQNYLNQYDITSTDYHARIQTGMSLHHQFQGSMYGCSLWKDWLLKHPSHAESTTLQQIEKKWASFSTNSNNPTTFASIIKIVNEQKIKKLKACPDYIQPLPNNIWQETEGKYFLPLDTLANLEILLREYKITLQYDTIAKDEIIIYPGRDENNNNKLNDGITYIRNCCKVNKMKTGDLREMVSHVTNKNQINPFFDFIKSSPWDGKNRIDDMYETVIVSAEQKNIRNIYLKKWFMSAVHLSCLNDELKGKFAKGVLVFQGIQDAGKTSWFRSLLPPELHKYQDDGITIDPNSSDSVVACIQNIMVELGEIDSTFRKTDISRFKQFVTKTSDTARLPYEAKARTFKRQTVFMGSVNDRKFLVDDTGNSRFMIISVHDLNYNHEIDLQQFWAEIYHYCQQGEQYWLTDEERNLQFIANKDYEQLCPYEEKIRLNFDLESEAKFNISATRILEILGYTNISKKQTNEMARTLDRMGFKRGSSKIGGWFLPKEKNIFDDVDITT